MSTLPANTTVRDFAYSIDHPFHGGTDYLGGNSEDEDPLVSDEINKKAVALFDFEPENDNEVPLREGQIIWISYRHGQGWLVAEDPETGENGLVPEEYVEMWEEEDEPKRFMPELLGFESSTNKHLDLSTFADDDDDDEWETEEEET